MSKRTTLTLSTTITAIAFAIAWSFKGAKDRKGKASPAPLGGTPTTRSEADLMAERMAADEDAGEAIEAAKVKLPRKRVKAPRDAADTDHKDGQK